MSIQGIMKRLIITNSFLFLILGCTTQQSELDKIELLTLEGKPIRMTDYQGKTVFINFWATWCKPCVREMPTIAKAKEQLSGKMNVVFLFPSNEEVDRIREFKEKRGFDFNFVRVQNLEALNIQALPTTFIFNPEGKLIFSEAGFRDWGTPENLTLISNNE